MVAIILFIIIIRARSGQAGAKEKDYQAEGMGLGFVLGLSLGVAFKLASPGLAAALGMALGLVLGSRIKRKDQAEDNK